MTYLFGNILIVNQTDLLFRLVLCIVIIGFFLLQFKYILYIAFDEEYAKARRLPVNLIKYIMISLIVLTIVFNIRVVGIILVISLLTIPQTIANMFIKRFYGIMILSVLIALLGTVSGLILSYVFDIPSGAAIIFFLIIMTKLNKKDITCLQRIAHNLPSPFGDKTFAAGTIYSMV